VKFFEPTVRVVPELSEFDWISSPDPLDPSDEELSSSSLPQATSPEDQQVFQFEH
jgi:hypothetical protein